MAAHISLNLIDFGFANIYSNDGVQQSSGDMSAFVALHTADASDAHENDMDDAIFDGGMKTSLVFATGCMSGPVVGAMLYRIVGFAVTAMYIRVLRSGERTFERRGK